MTEREIFQSLFPVPDNTAIWNECSQSYLPNRDYLGKTWDVDVVAEHQNLRYQGFLSGRASLKEDARIVAAAKKILTGDVDNEITWAAHDWLQKNSTVQLGLSTINGLFKFMRDKQIDAAIASNTREAHE